METAPLEGSSQEASRREVESLQPQRNWVIRLWWWCILLLRDFRCHFTFLNLFLFPQKKGEY